MVQPVTGTTWSGAGLNDLGPEFLEIGMPMQVLVRDARGEATDISPHNADGSVRWSPFAQDNRFRSDLLAQIRQGGYLVSNPDPNEGFLTTGAFKDGNGPQSKPRVRNNVFRIVQNNYPYYTSLTEESEAFSFTPVDTARPVVQHLRKNLRLANTSGDLVVLDPGAQNAGFSRTLLGQNPGRQFLVCREIQTNKTGLPVYKVDGYSLARQSDLGNSKKEKDDSEASELTYEPEPDNIMMGVAPNEFGELEYQPILMHTWYGGPGWTALGGVPVMSSTPPTAVAGAAGEATLSFPEPTGVGDPWTYTAQQSTDAGSTWGSEIIPSSVTVTAGVVTLTLTALTAGASVFRATAAGTNGATGTTPTSNSVTII